MTAVQEVAALVDAQENVSLRRVRFVAQAPPKAERIAEFTHPVRRLAVVDRLPLDCLPSAQQSVGRNEFLVLLLSGGADTPFALRRLAEEWIGKANGADDPPLQVNVQSDQILWRRGKAVIVGASGRWAQLLAGVAEFTFHEAQLRELEDYLAGCWDEAEQDVSLVHVAGSRAPARTEHVSERARELALARMRFARVLEPLGNPSAALPSHARRLIGELLVYTGVEGRLELVDERLEVLEDVYQAANERLVTLSHHRAEVRLELSIAILLFLELIVMLWQILEKL